MRSARASIPILLLIQAACSAHTPRTADLRQLADLPGEIDFVTGDVSPDGRYLSEVDWESGDLRLVDLRTGDARGATGEGYDGGGYAWTSAFSRDGKRLAVAWYRDAERRHELRIVARDGSGNRLLVPVSDSVQYIDPLDWTAGDEQILVALRGEDYVWHLGLVGVTDGSLHILTTLSWLAPGGEQTYPNAYVSPDGRFIAYDYRPDVETHGRDIYGLSIDGAREFPLLSDPADDRVLGWLRDGSGILIYSDRDGAPGVWRLAVRDGRATGQPQRVRSDLRGLIPLGVTTAGYVFGRASASQQIHLGALDHERGKVVTTPRPVGDPAAQASLAGDWSPDGTRLLYVTHDPMPAGTETLVTRSLTGDRISTVVLPASLHTSTGTLRWIEERRVVLFASERGRYGVYELDPRTGHATRLPVSGDGLEGGNLKWVEPGPDGRTLYLFRPQGAGGRANELLAIDVATGQPRVLGTFDADPRTLAVSPDGEELALIVRDRAGGASELRVIPSSGEGMHRVILRTMGRPGPTSPVAWTPDGSRLVFAVPSPGGRRVLWSAASDGTGPPVEVGGEDWCCSGHDLRFHPDSRHIAVPAGWPRVEVWLLAW